MGGQLTTGDDGVRAAAPRCVGLGAGAHVRGSGAGRACVLHPGRFPGVRMLFCLASLFAAHAADSAWSVAPSGAWVGFELSVLSGPLDANAAWGGLPPERTKALAACVDVPGAPKELVLVLTVDAQGAVAAVSSSASSEVPAAEACAQEAVSAARFPAGAASRVQVLVHPGSEMPDLSGLIGARGVQIGGKPESSGAPAAGGESVGGLVGMKTKSGPPPGAYTPGPGVNLYNSGIVILGALDKALIDGVVRANFGALETCYADARKAAPTLAGRVVVKFVIDKTGAVSSATIKSSSVGNAALEECLTRTFASWRFPAPKGGGIVIASYPFDFVPN